MKKKVFAILCVVMCVFMLSACGNNSSLGKTVFLDSYEQDNNLSDGAEPIEWQVVGTRDGHTLLLSKYVLDYKKYNDEYSENTTWKDCTLRAWLNNDFYNTAFSDSDKLRIVTAHNENPDSHELYRPWNPNLLATIGVDGGYATDDNVFLLSWTEARDYLDGKVYDDNLLEGNNNQKLLGGPTAYTKAQGIKVLSALYFMGDCCEWWLRSPGSRKCDAATVDTFGSIDDSILNYRNGVRPAILID